MANPSVDLVPSGNQVQPQPAPSSDFLDVLIEAVCYAVRFVFSSIGGMLSAVISLGSRDISSSSEDRSEIQMGDIVNIVPELPEKVEDKSREIFENIVEQEAKRLRLGGMVGDNVIQLVTLAMSLKYQKKCNLTISQGNSPFASHHLLVTRKREKDEEPQKLLQEEEGIRIRTVCIQGKGLFAFFLSQLPFAKPVYSENHITGFIGNQYFDAKGLSYEESLHLEEDIIPRTIGEIGETLGEDITSNTFQHQDKTDRTSCGVFFLLEIEKHLTGRAKEPPKKMSAKEIQEARERLAQLIEQQLLGSSEFEVQSTINPSSPGIEPLDDQEFKD